MDELPPLAVSVADWPLQNIFVIDNAVQIVHNAGHYTADEEDYLAQFVLRDGVLHDRRVLDGASGNLAASLAQEGVAPPDND